jgi:hypothetical protein
MKRRRPPFIKQRRPVFIGCEGASEAGYAGLLQSMLREAALPVHLVIHELGRGAGDPCSRIELAVQRLGQLRRTRIAPPERFVMLDADQTDRERADRARQLALENSITIVWQHPCFEAVLLRHLQDRATRQPPDTPEAERALAREWPDYRKPMTSAALGQRIDLDAIKRAAAVEPELQKMLRCLGLA